MMSDLQMASRAGLVPMLIRLVAQMLRPVPTPIRWAGVCCLTFAVLGIPQVHAAERRVALVVGNSAYRFVSPLPNPENDARLMATTLRGLGFTLVTGGAVLNADKAGFDAAVRSFGQQIVGADVAVFYYAGHGLQVQDKNWLVPVSANPTRVEDLDFEMIDAGLVTRQMEGAGTHLNLIILDACRNNPFAARGWRSIGSGLAQMMAPDATIIAYATQPGAVAADGSGRDSPYTQALSQTIRTPGLDVLRMFNDVALQVKRQTNGAQVPWLSASPIDGEFAFAGPGAAPVASPRVSQTALSDTRPGPEAPPPAPVAPPTVSQAAVSTNTPPKASHCTVKTESHYANYNEVTMNTTNDGFCNGRLSRGSLNSAIKTKYAFDHVLVSDKPEHGKVIIEKTAPDHNPFHYTPPPGFVGEDSFILESEPLGFRHIYTVHVTAK